MPTILFIIVALIHISLLVHSFRVDLNPSIRLWFLRLLLTTLTLDNIALSLGNLAVGSEWFEPMTRARFVMHVTVLPLLTLFAWSAMKAAGVNVASRPAFAAFAWVFTLSALAYGFYHEVILLEVGPVEAFGHWRMTNLSPVPPIATIVTNMLVIPLGALIWRAGGPKALFGGALFALVSNGALASQPWGFMTGNLTEVVFILCLLHAERALVKPGST